MTKIKVAEAIRLYNEIKGMDDWSISPASILYGLKRIKDKLLPVQKRYEEIRMDKIVNIYGEPAERGGYEIKDVEKIKLFNLDMIEILNQEDEIDVNIIPVEELET